jgi:hypothetical protein
MLVALTVRKMQMRKETDPMVESTGADGIYEILVEESLN